MIGLLGAHRTGKSTLCQALLSAGRGSFWEKEISISKMQKEMGYDSSNQSYDWETRKSIQAGLLDAFFKKLHEPFTQSVVQHTVISERTPLDLIGYLVMNAPENPTAEDLEWIDNYIANCIALTNVKYSKVFLLQPGIEYVECATSAKEDSMDVLNAIYLKTLLDPRLTVDRVIVPQEMTDLTERVLFVMENKNV